jgi:hypothetical protein
MAWTPEVWLVFGISPQIIGIKLVEPSAAQVQLFSGGSGGQFITAKSSKDFTNQRRAQTVRKLAIMFFIATKMGQSKSNDQREGSSFADLPSASATFRPPPGPQSWRGFAFARNAAVNFKCLIEKFGFKDVISRYRGGIKEHLWRHSFSDKL